MLCCEAGNSEMADLLLNSPANPNLQQSVCIHYHELYHDVYLSSEHWVHCCDVCLYEWSSRHSHDTDETWC